MPELHDVTTAPTLSCRLIKTSGGCHARLTLSSPSPDWECWQLYRWFPASKEHELVDELCRVQQAWLELGTLGLVSWLSDSWRMR